MHVGLRTYISSMRRHVESMYDQDNGETATPQVFILKDVQEVNQQTPGLYLASSARKFTTSR